MYYYKQVTLWTSETIVKEGLQRNYYKKSLSSQVALCCQTNAYCEGLGPILFSKQSITAAILAEGLDTDNCLPTEYGGYVTTAADTVADVADIWSEG